MRVVRELTSRGYNADREAVTLLAGADDPVAAVDRVVEAAPEDAATLSVEDVRELLADDSAPDPMGTDDASGSASSSAAQSSPDQTSTSTGRSTTAESVTESTTPAETKGVNSGVAGESTRRETAGGDRGESGRAANADLRSVDVEGDITGESTGTGEYKDFVSVFRDRYDRLSKQLRGRVNHRPTSALESMPGGSDAAVVGVVNDVRSTASGHWLVELEDTNGVFPALVMKDRDIASLVDDLLLDEVIAVEGTLADDGGIIFVDDLHFPEVPRTYDPNTADRHVQAALISDVHVGSQEFAVDAWQSFADWLHTPEAESVEYLLVAGDMVEGVGVYPGQDEELDVVDIYEQYEAFAEHLKDVPGDMEIVMIPGNHDAVRLAEPQPAFDEELRSIMSAHDAQFTGNPSTVTIEGVSVLMYHGVSIDEVIAEHPSDEVSYDNPHRAMELLLKKRHVAPKFGGRNRIAPEEKDYLTIDTVPDVFHTGHVHKLGVGAHHNVRLVNSGCWQHQTAFQESVNIDPDVATAPILDLDTLDITVRKFA